MKTIEEVLQERLQSLAKDVRKSADEALDDLTSDILPYLMADTEMNIELYVAEAVRKIISGEFQWDGDYIRINPVREFSPSIRIAFSTMVYDKLRDKIIEGVPKCPKDAKIASLEEELKWAYETRY